MIVYNRAALNDEYINGQLEDLLRDRLIEPEEEASIREAHPRKLYTPNFFVTLGLFLLTVIIVSFTFGFFLLVFASGGWEPLMIGMGLLCYGAAEFMARKGHYRSGVDTALSWMAVGMIIGGINSATDVSDAWNAVLTLVLAGWMAARFGDAVMAVIAWLMLLWWVFLICGLSGQVLKAAAPFILATLSAAAYILVSRIDPQRSLRHYRHAITLLRIATLVTLYGSINYFVVRELSNEMFHLHLQSGETIPFGWLFWALTALIPLSDIYLGIRRKDAILLRVGLILAVCSIITFRFYHAVLPVETALLLGGLLLVAGAYGLLRWLHIPRHGFTADPLAAENEIKKQVEAIMIGSITATVNQPVSGTTHFGGGTGSGGGAGGDF